MEDRTTPHLKPEGHQAVLAGSDFLTGREAHLQARLNELDADLADLGDVPDGVEGLEQQALDALRALSDLLEPPAPVPTTTPQPELMPASLPAMQAVSHWKPWRVVGIVVVLLATALSAFSLLWMYGPDLLGDNGLATAIAQATAPCTAMPPAPTTASPTQPPVTLTPIPSLTITAPHPGGTRPETPGQNREIIQAERVEILDATGPLRLELPLSVMADRVRVVDGRPVLQPVLPASGAGVYRGSVPFGETGNVIIAIPPEAAPTSLWQTRPGDRLTGCNSDDACHDYQVTTADTWPLERLRQLLANWSLGNEVLLYAAVDESNAWVIQAQPAYQEGTR